MPYTMAAKRDMLNAFKGTNPTIPVTHAGLLTAGTAITGATAVHSTDTFTKASHGLNNGDLVVLTSLTGGTGLKTNVPYFVVGVSGNDFQLSYLSGGAAVNFSSDVSDATIVKLTEVSGGSYVRKAITFDAASVVGVLAASNTPAIDCPASAVVNYIGLYSAETSGTLLAIDDVTQETFGAAGTYTITSFSGNLNLDLV